MRFTPHLLNFSNTINGLTYTYQSTGGIIMLLCLLICLVTKYFFVANMNVLLIAVASVAAGMLWNALTAGLYWIKIRTVLRKLGIA
jgi:hypothetical protein